MEKIVPYLIIGAVALVILIILIKNICIVQQSRAYVIERLGAFSQVWEVGIHFKLPFVERIARRVSLKEQVLDYPPQPVITKDNVTMQIDTVVYFQITDPKLYTYGVEQPMVAMETLTATTLRNIIGDLELDQTRGAEEHPAAAGHPELHGKADEGRARPPSGHPAGRGHEALADPRRRG